MNPETRIAVLADVDAIRLDRDCSLGACCEELETLRRGGIPLILFSSKTRAEIEVLQRKLDLRHPFVSENGGALFIPRNYFPFPIKNGRRIGGYDAIEFGAPYYQLVAALHRVAEQTGVPAVGFSDLSIEEVAKECGLTLAEARLAKLREYDEPFRILDPSPAARSKLLRGLHRAGVYRCTSTGNYHHLMGLSDRAMAVRMVTALFVRAWEDVLTVGVGDSANDLSLLREVDIPIIVHNTQDGAVARLLRKVPNAHLAVASGPGAWGRVLAEVAASREPAPLQPVTGPAAP